MKDVTSNNSFVSNKRNVTKNKVQHENPIDIAIKEIENGDYTCYNDIEEFKKDMESEESDITKKINNFIACNPDAFCEFSDIKKVGLEALRELTKDDEW